MRLLLFSVLVSLSAINFGQAQESGWQPFAPARTQPGDAPSLIDLRFLNETTAGEHGHLVARDVRIIRSGDGQAVRFWGVNGPPRELRGEALRDCARLLARHGVNLVRIHTPVFDKVGAPDAAKIEHFREVVAAMKSEGIYTWFSIYFPLWLTPKPGTAWLAGYDGTKHPFAALFFNAEFQARYRDWWRALLTSPASGATGSTLAEEPAIAGVEIQNEDSFFFWTFTMDNLPDEQARRLEQMFSDWAKARYGSVDSALAKWSGLKVRRDAPAEGRLSFRPLWSIANERTLRDQDTATFLFETQTRFYEQTRDYLRSLKFRGLISASNWSTASPEYFGPLEKLSYTVTDIVDRHGYFGCLHKGDNSAWSIRPGHTYVDRSAYRFDPEDPAKTKLFLHPGMDPHYADKPSMISETTWTRPNRFRSEAPIYLAAYGALQGSDAIIHFALDGADWKVKPNFWMQPWTLMSPALMGQFPAAALIYRRGLVTEGPVVARINLNSNELLRLQGTPLPQEAALDELRLQDVATNAPAKVEAASPAKKSRTVLDPLLHYVGRTHVTFGPEPSTRNPQPLAVAAGLIDRKAARVLSATKELALNYAQGILTINAPAAQGISGLLGSQTNFETGVLSLRTSMELGHVLLVALDSQPLTSSRRMLLQVMSEERPTGFTTEDAGKGLKKITHLGTDPWLYRNLSGTLRFKRPDAAKLTIRPLDLNGRPTGQTRSGPELTLDPHTLYYLIESPKG